MSEPHPRRAAATVGVAGAGLVLGHWVAYALGTPHAHARDEVLRATGHGYLPYATQVAVLGAALSLAALFLARLTRREGRGSFVRDAAVLAAAQSIAFVAMEVGERLASGASMHDLTHGPLLALGLAVQLVVAIAGAGLLRLTDRVAEGADALAAIVAPPAPFPVTAVAGHAAVAPLRPAMRATASRAPPSFA
jgi:hypothetical protein